MEQTAFFFAYLGLVLILTVITRIEQIHSNMLCILAGITIALAILSKQNAGLFILPVYLILLSAAEKVAEKNYSLRCIMMFISGLAGVFALFLIWIFVFSDINRFIQYFFKIPYDVGRQRVFYNPFLLVNILIGIGPSYNVYAIAIFLFLAFYFLVKYLIDSRFRSEQTKHLFYASILYIYLTYYQYFFI